MVSQDLEKVKKNIRAILISNKNGVTEKDFIIQYRELCCFKVPYESFGFRTLDNFMESLSDTVAIREAHGMTIYSEIPQKDTLHISKLVKSQNNSKTGTKVPSIKEQKAKKGKTKRLPSQEIATIKEVILKFPKGVDEETFSMNFIEAFGKPLDFVKYGFQDMKECLESVSTFVQIRSKHRGGVFIYPSKTLKDEVVPKNTKLSTGSIPGSVVDDLEHLMKDFPKGMDKDLLLDEYKKKYGSQLDFQDYGFSNLFQLVKSLSYVFQIEKEGSSTRLWHPSLKKKATTLSLSEVNENLRKVLEAEKGIILSIDIGDFYKKHIGMDVDIFFLGFQSMDGLLHALSSEKDATFEMQEIAGPRFLVKLLPSSKASLPSKSPVLGLKQLKFPHSGLVDVLVEEFKSPLDFHVRLVKYEQDLVNLMKNLGDFCKRNKSSLRMVKEDFQIGNPVAALFATEWHRAEILDTSPHKVKLLYVDYGTVYSISPEKILRLGTEFYSLPQQAIKVQLGGVGSQSFDEGTVKEIKSRFNNFREPGIFGKLVSPFDDDSSVPSIELVQTVGDELVSFNGLFASNKRNKAPLRKPHSETLGKKSSSNPTLDQIPLSSGRDLKYILDLEANGKYHDALVTSSGVSNLFPKWKLKDLLVIMLNRKNMSFQPLRLMKQDHPKLWSTASSVVPGFDKEEVTLFRLVDVPQMITIFTKTEDDTMKRISNRIGELGLSK